MSQFTIRELLTSLGYHIFLNTLKERSGRNCWTGKQATRQGHKCGCGDKLTNRFSNTLDEQLATESACDSKKNPGKRTIYARAQCADANGQSHGLHHTRKLVLDLEPCVTDSINQTFTDNIACEVIAFLLHQTSHFHDGLHQKSLLVVGELADASKDLIDSGLYVNFAFRTLKDVALAQRSVNSTDAVNVDFIVFAVTDVNVEGQTVILTATQTVVVNVQRIRSYVEFLITTNKLLPVRDELLGIAFKLTSLELLPVKIVNDVSAFDSNTIHIGAIRSNNGSAFRIDHLLADGLAEQVMELIDFVHVQTDTALLRLKARLAVFLVINELTECLSLSALLSTLFTTLFVLLARTGLAVGMNVMDFITGLNNVFGLQVLRIVDDLADSGFVLTSLGRHDNAAHHFLIGLTVTEIFGGTLVRECLLVLRATILILHNVLVRLHVVSSLIQSGSSIGIQGFKARATTRLFKCSVGFFCTQIVHRITFRFGIQIAKLSVNLVLISISSNVKLRIIVRRRIASDRIGVNGIVHVTNTLLGLAITVMRRIGHCGESTFQLCFLRHGDMNRGVALSSLTLGLEYSTFILAECNKSLKLTVLTGNARLEYVLTKEAVQFFCDVIGRLHDSFEGVVTDIRTRIELHDIVCVICLCWGHVIDFRASLEL